MASSSPILRIFKRGSAQLSFLSTPIVSPMFLSSLGVNVSTMPLDLPQFFKELPDPRVKLSPVKVLKPVLPSEAKISREIACDDTNALGLVQAGSAFKLLDQAGSLAATQHINQGRDEDFSAHLVRIEPVNFHAPMFKGEVAHLSAKTIFASPHSVEVEVELRAENKVTMKHRHVNKTRIWYVAAPMKISNSLSRLRVAEISPLIFHTADEEKARFREYNERKALKGQGKPLQQWEIGTYGYGSKVHSVGAAASSLVRKIVSSNCSPNGVAHGGTILKLMDHIAEISAIRHCKTQVVLGSTNALNVLAPIYRHNVCSLLARPIFTSDHTVHIEVQVYAEDPLVGTSRLTNSSVFSYVAIDKARRVTKVPKLVIETVEEEDRFRMAAADYVSKRKGNEAQI